MNVIEETYYCLALSLVPGLGRSRLIQLLRRGESPQKLLHRLPGMVQELHLPEEAREFLCRGRALRAADGELARIERESMQVTSVFDVGYPDLLKTIHDPPVVLYSLGRVDVLSRPSVAVVGSRRCTLYGKEVTRSFARQLAAAGLCVVSGMARGADTEAHLGALEERAGETVAVLGNGLDIIYPRENRRLLERICGRGCAVSEFPCGTFPAPQNFPIRNRIISGLCYGTLVTEASEYSGSLITARQALDQNREVWAVPGNITSAASCGPNVLIRQGAKVTLDLQDILEELPPDLLHDLAGEKAATGMARVPLTADEEKVVGLLAPDKGVHIDHLLLESGLEASRLNEVLLQLEIKGWISQLPGGRFHRRFS